jgi:hypothetical protein
MTRRRSVVAGIILVLVSATAAYAQTSERPGVEGKFGQVMKLATEKPLYFTLKSAEFTAASVRIGDKDFVPSRDEKLLVIHFSLQNPLKEEQGVAGNRMRLTVVDANNANHEAESEFGVEGKTVPLSMSLKPAQRVDAYAVFFVPAKGVVPKLMVAPLEETAPVIRYDLRKKVKPVPAPFADPSDKTGATALASIVGAIGTWYPISYFDLRVDGAAYSTQPVPDQDLEEGTRNFLITMTWRNRSAEERTASWATFYIKLLLNDGSEADWNQIVLMAASNKPGSASLKPGAEVQVRLYYPLPLDSKAKIFSIYEGGLMGDSSKLSRELTREFSGVQ